MIMLRRKCSKFGFSIAEALITLAIVGVAMSSAAPLISKTMKNSQVGNFQIMRINRDLDALRTEMNNMRTQLTNRIAAVETNVTELRTDLNTLSTTVSTMNTNLTNLTNRVTSLDNATNGRVTVLERNLASLTGTVNNMSTTVNNLSYSLNNLTTRVGSLENTPTNTPPAGSLMFLASGSCPSGYTNVSSTYSGRFLKISTTAGTSEDAVLPQHWHGVGNFTQSGNNDANFVYKNFIHSGSTYSCRQVAGEGSGGGEGTCSAELQSWGIGTTSEIYNTSTTATTTFNTLQPKAITVIACKKNP